MDDQDEGGVTGGTIRRRSGLYEGNHGIVAGKRDGPCEKGVSRWVE